MGKVRRGLIGLGITTAAATWMVSDIESNDRARIEVAESLAECADQDANLECVKILMKEMSPSDIQPVEGQQAYFFEYPADAITAEAESIRNEAEGPKNELMGGGAVLLLGGLVTLMAVNEKFRRLMSGELYR